MPRAILTRRVPPSDNQEQQIELAIADHVHLCLRITQMFRVAHTVGLFRGKALPRKWSRETRLTLQCQCWLNGNSVDMSRSGSP